jgi:spore germination protein YaaH
MSRRRTASILAGVLAIASLVGGCAALPGGQPATQVSPYNLRIVAGYVVPEDDRSITAIGESALTEVSPVWYQPTETGQLAFASLEAQQSQSEIATQLSAGRVALVPAISNYVGGQWDGDLIHRLITDPRLRAAHIAAIVDVARSGQWAGVDLDYESLRAEDRDAYSAFVREVAAALHQAQKKLTLAVHAKTEEPGDWSGAQAQDWRALGASADEVRVMAYDYSTDASPPGPIAPVAWVECVVDLAVAEVPRAKIVLGLGTYGYDWVAGAQGQALQWTEAEALAHKNGVDVRWDAATKSPWFEFTDDRARSHTVWYENARSLKARLDLAARYRVAGVALWRLGGEDPAIWALLRQAG